MTTLTQIERERRHSQYSQALLSQNGHYLEAAASELLNGMGWKWQPRQNSWSEGWWILPGDEQYGRPLGDAKPLAIRAYTTVQLYTEIDLSQMEAKANELRNEDRRRGLRY